MTPRDTAHTKAPRSTLDPTTQPPKPRRQMPIPTTRPPTGRTPPRPAPSPCAPCPSVTSVQKKRRETARRAHERRHRPSATPTVPTRTHPPARRPPTPVLPRLRHAADPFGSPSGVTNLGRDQAGGDQAVCPGQQCDRRLRPAILDEPCQCDAGIGAQCHHSRRPSRTTYFARPYGQAVPVPERPRIRSRVPRANEASRPGRSIPRFGLQRPSASSGSAAQGTGNSVVRVPDRDLTHRVIVR